eukprot:scaffold54_cov158-Amphora_coffeaeformis.AAC.3
MTLDQELRHRKYVVGDEVDVREMEALMMGQPSTVSSTGERYKGQRRLWWSSSSPPRIGLYLVIGSSAWIILAFVTLLYLVTSKPRNQHYFHESPSSTTTTLRIKKTMNQQRRPVLEVYVQDTSSASEAAAAAFPHRWETKDSRQQQQRIINCHEPYRSLPLLLESVNDPFLPWIHDYFVTDNNDMVRFVAQNKRRCHTGRGKKEDMAFWEPQMALFQPVSIAAIHSKKKKKNNSGTTTTYHLTDPEDADFPETRFRCRFRSPNDDGLTAVTFSVYPFNYEYINWRKRADNPMFVKDGPDVKIVDYSTLLFECPIPLSLRKEARLYLDLIPIRTRARYDEGYLLTAQQIGEAEFAKLKRFDAVHEYGNQTELPDIQQIGRIENLPICLPKSGADTTTTTTTSNSQNNNNTRSKPRHRLVACAWVAASYERRGGKSSVSDTPQRLKEWLAFHQLAGFDQIYIYDNTQVDDNDDTRNDERMPLKEITNLFPGFVTWIRWPGTMSPVLGMRESRARPRFDLMEETSNTHTCSRDSKNASLNNTSDVSCLVPRSDETFLAIFNCDSVKPPRPRGYFTNMKQIYRPDFVLSHFVHYSLITRGIAEYYKDKKDPAQFRRRPSEEEKGLSFIDEIHEGTMVHSRSVLPYETSEWSTSCVKESNHECKVGFVCPDSTRYDDRLVNKNMFVDEKGDFCNCWRSQHIDEWVPKLEASLRKLETPKNQ